MWLEQSGDSGGYRRERKQIAKHDKDDTHPRPANLELTVGDEEGDSNP